MADVKLLKYDGTEQQYRGVERVQLAKVDGGTAIFSEGEAVEGIEISPDFSSGDMPVIAPTGTLVKSAVIVKPETLVPENILAGVEIGGVTGELDPPDPVETEVTLDFSEGDMEVVPDAGKLFSKVSIPVPENLIPENIAKDVVVAGIKGIHEGGVEVILPVIQALEITANGTYTAPEGVDGYSPVTVSIEGSVDTEEIDMYLDQINGENINGKVVTFIGSDGSVLCKVTVAPGLDCQDPVETNLITRPAKEPTVSTTYSFIGWSLTEGGDADSTALENVTEDRVVYAAFVSYVRTYTVRFYDGDTVLKTVKVAYGSSASYTPAKKDGYIFKEWKPSPNYITGDTDCYAQWNASENLADYTWGQIAEIAESGEAATRFVVGDTKPLSVTVDSENYTFTGRLIGFNHDDLSDGTGKAGMTFEIYDLPKIGLAQKMNKYYPESDAWLNFDQNAKDFVASDLKQHIKQVSKKCYRNADQTIGTLDAYMWRFSIRELNFSDSMIPNDGEPYEFYNGTNRRTGSQYEELIRYDANTGNNFKGAVLWNTRSMAITTESAESYWYIDRAGACGRGNVGLASEQSPVLCFCL